MMIPDWLKAFTDGVLAIIITIMVLELRVPHDGDVEAERYYRRHAVRRLEEALAAFDYISRDERAAYTYLVGELWRRIGDTARAASWFDRVPREITKPAGQQWVLFAAKQQQESPREWFS